MSIHDGDQAGYAVIAAAFVTGLWAWVAQRSRRSDDDEKIEIVLDQQDRQDLVQNYREFNVQLQTRVTTLNDEVVKLWENVSRLQKELTESDRQRIENGQHIALLESSVKVLTKDVEDCKRDKKDLERENARLYRMLSGKDKDA